MLLETGLVTFDQLLPSQCKIVLSLGFPLSGFAPTAHPSVAQDMEIPDKATNEGLLTTFHVPNVGAG